ncbi:Na-transporting methylmalonyl-CoA/oxaloacetate decarboxylase [[Clostridium] sordellii]|uniref:Na-transporting methylmalonyl-CoA/oxaloacetate decarboxylase n=2 Tax=Paraclostridium sordellii TaxID=1505 RepID=A0A0C7G7Y6_PARSO|nr:Na-transporting methylmalonyl-CoA/oxaloacetate decarboxylase [[Clostridium] sordellii] [Paeniclostridium sordellii]CEN79160.1 Na-transporting methylmalonyl-CoA/oxaloacetate decarboxylase [[Clostridium] sordellii] [Paeniclostridium sordellii]CEP88406.1 Na-transporting methylmalonyl-CoA/oxaloacetate decarboxylase [[Clostridium] sordellii] [Paeniclostridium sordellii]CEQ00684.1 Na-transporting methylmalonyl-CoA/oxaloacetate decarboxylase [[Clostridium] sordellii] [Paeniclostridium sordellii]CEQ
MEAINITISSMAIVFLTLILISLVLASFKYIFKTKSQVKEKLINKNLETTNANFEEDDEEDKIVVALAASIMAGEGKIDPNLHVKRITRIK